MDDADRKRILLAVNELGSRVEAAGLVRGAISSGFLAHCREPATAAGLARATGLERGVVDAVCHALRSIGVLAGAGQGQGEDAQVVISDLYAPLLEDGLGQRALDRLTAAQTRATMFRDLFSEGPSSYWNIDSASRLALAANATTDPGTQFGRDTLVAGVRAIPDMDDAFTRGGRFLDLGCGVAGGIVTFLYSYPRLTAVGIDIAEDVLEVARARARALGVAERTAFLVADAARFRDPEPFDVVFWPQTFYPEATRAGALATAFASLRPGGLLVTANVPPPPRPDASGPADAGAGPALDHLLRTLWGIQERSFEALSAELKDAGFVNIVSVAATGIVLPKVTANRPG